MKKNIRLWYVIDCKRSLLFLLILLSLLLLSSLLYCHCYCYYDYRHARILEELFTCNLRWRIPRDDSCFYFLSVAVEREESSAKDKIDRDRKDSPTLDGKKQSIRLKLGVYENALFSELKGVTLYKRKQRVFKRPGRKEFWKFFAVFSILPRLNHTHRIIRRSSIFISQFTRKIEYRFQVLVTSTEKF